MFIKFKCLEIKNFQKKVYLDIKKLTLHKINLYRNYKFDYKTVNYSSIDSKNFSIEVSSTIDIL